jgi:hypothetical protein
VCAYYTQNFKAFKELFVSVVSLLNPNGSEELYGQAADDLIALETSLAQVRNSIYSWVLLNNIIHWLLSTDLC